MNPILEVLKGKQVKLWIDDFAEFVPENPRKVIVWMAMHRGLLNSYPTGDGMPTMYGISSVLSTVRFTVPDNCVVIYDGVQDGFEVVTIKRC